MTKEKFNVDINKLSKLNLYQLREVGSKIGVRNPTSMKTEELKNAIKLVVTGKVEPYEKVKSGRPHRKEIISDNEWDTLVGFDTSIDYNFFKQPTELGIFCSPQNALNFDTTHPLTGVVMQIANEIVIFYGSVSKLNLAIRAKIDNKTLNKGLVRFGDSVTAIVEYDDLTLHAKEIISINSHSPTELNRQDFDLMQPKFFGETIKFNLPQLQFINNICPFKLGQRALIRGEIGSGQNYLANSIAKDLQDKYSVIYLATNKRPEEQIALNNAEYIFTTFDILPQELWLYVDTAYNRAKRLCELGKNVILIVDDLIMLMQNLRNILSEKGVDAEKHYYNILQQCKKLFALSRNTTNGSITVICTISKCAITEFNEFVDDLNELCNCHITLVREDFVKGKDEFFDKNLTYTEIAREI